MFRTQVLQIDLQHGCQPLGRGGVATPLTRLDLREILRRQVYPSGELSLAQLPLQAPVLEAWELEPSTSKGELQLITRATFTRIATHAQNPL